MKNSHFNGHHSTFYLRYYRSAFLLDILSRSPPYSRPYPGLPSVVNPPGHRLAGQMAFMRLSAQLACGLHDNLKNFLMCIQSIIRGLEGN